MPTARDPREIITPDAFSVASQLLGRRLAHPWRRAVAMAVDGVALVIVGAVGWLFVGGALTVLSLRRAIRASGEGASRLRRLGYAALGTLTLAATLLVGWISWFEGGRQAVVETAGEVLTTRLGDAGAAVGGVVTLLRADTEVEFKSAAQEFVGVMERQGMSRSEIRETLESIAEDRDEPWVEGAVADVLAAADMAPPPPETGRNPDSLAIAYAEALQGGDTARAAALREPLVETVAGDRLARLDSTIADLREANRELERDLEEERERGLISLLLQVADEVGLGLGWAGFYFTFFLVVWKGRTPGKRLLGIRVVRLDGHPIGWWVSFNRFGGYAASIFTGLLGFFEMFWDPNRQALHDRIAWTVVVRD